LDSPAHDLAWELLATVTRVPLTIQDPDTTSAVIGIIGRELAYSQYTSHHRRISYHLLRIVDVTLRTRALTVHEIGTIRDVASRRLSQDEEDLHFSCRPCEVRIFGKCASQDPWFEEVVLGPRGLQSLFYSLDLSLSKTYGDEDRDRFSQIEIVTSLDRLLEYSWVTQAVKPSEMRILLDTVRQRPEALFVPRCRAIKCIHTIISHRPALLRTLIQEKARPVFENFASNLLRRRVSKYFETTRDKASESVNILLKRIEKWHTDGDILVEPPLELTGMGDIVNRNKESKPTVTCV